MVWQYEYLNMPIKLLFFGSTATVTNIRECEVPFPRPMTALEVLDLASIMFRGLSSLTLQIAINQRHASYDEIVSDGDELAIFTAVSGG